ncbi:MAG: potassium-transporting ATPase subunit KdpC [Parabacteroides sp.]|nr:potassium-transporting ATPase subunit KdpC [Parabacteroides sp.]
MKNLCISVKITLAMCMVLAVGYVFILWLAAVAIAPGGGEATSVEVKGKAVGAAQVGQAFTEMRYFWGRPSAVNYNGGGSGGSNKATTNPEYLGEVEQRIDAFLKAHPYLARTDLPLEMVTASGSGLDPDISPRGAEVQIRRVAEARKMPEETVRRMVESVTEGPWLGLFGTPKVNVLKLNVALDAALENPRGTEK